MPFNLPSDKHTMWSSPPFAWPLPPPTKKFDKKLCHLIESCSFEILHIKQIIDHSRVSFHTKSEEYKDKAQLIHIQHFCMSLAFPLIFHPDLVCLSPITCLLLFLSESSLPFLWKQHVVFLLRVILWYWLIINLSADARRKISQQVDFMFLNKAQKFNENHSFIFFLF